MGACEAVEEGNKGGMLEIEEDMQRHVHVRVHFLRIPNPPFLQLISCSDIPRVPIPRVPIPPENSTSRLSLFGISCWTWEMM